MSQIPVVRCKKGVQFAVIAPGGFRILAKLDELSKVIGQDVWITAGTNDHSKGRHPIGEAYDVSVQGWMPAVIVRAVEHLRHVLGERFTVLYETPTTPADPVLARIATVNPHATAPHLHAQVKKDTNYPPVDWSGEGTVA